MLDSSGSAALPLPGKRSFPKLSLKQVSLPQEGETIVMVSWGMLRQHLLYGSQSNASIFTAPAQTCLWKIPISGAAKAGNLSHLCKHAFAPGRNLEPSSFLALCNKVNRTFCLNQLCSDSSHIKAHLSPSQAPVF